MKQHPASPTVAKLQRLFGGATPATHLLALALVESLGTDRAEALIKQVTPEGADLTATVPATRRPLSYFFGKTRYALKRLGFLDSQVEEIDKALAAAGQTLRDGEMLTPAEWSDKKFNDVSYYNYMLQNPADFERQAAQMPWKVAAEIRELRGLMARQQQLGSDPDTDRY